MKERFFLLVFFVFSLVIFSSCEDEVFSPYGEFQKRYSLNCIVRADTNLQITTLYQSYAPNNSPNTDRETTFIHNSSIRLWRGKDDIYFFKDTNVENKSFYYSKGLKPNPGDSLEIEAILPDGNRLKSKTKVPQWVKRDFNKLTEIIPPKDGNIVTFAWEPNEESQVFVPMLYIYYKEMINGIFTTQKKVVPWKYITENGKERGINRPPLKNSTINYDIKNIEKVLIAIGTNKNTEDIIISSLILELRVFDKNLSAYYLSVNRLNGDYTVRLDAKEFSNINGGYGIFGSFTDQKIAILFDNDYLTRFNFYQKTL